MKFSFSMKHSFGLTFALGLAVLAGPAFLRAADADEEARLIQTVQLSSNTQAIGTALDRLQRIGTARCVPAVAGWLTGESQLAQSARQVLETMPAPEAGQALIEALLDARGLVKFGIIMSLGVRREARAVAALSAELSYANPEVANARAAAAALGKIGGADALQALLHVFPTAKGDVHNAVVDGLLACGKRLVEEGNGSAARPVFEMLVGPKEKDFFRTAAFRGLLLASGDEGVALAVAAIQGEDGPKQVAALQIARELPGDDTTLKLAALLPKVPVPVQVSLMGALDQRGDSAAAGAILPFANSAEPAVRLAAISALGNLAGAEATGALLEAAAAPDAATQKAGREALLVLRRGDVTQSLLAQLASAKPAVQAEAVRALGGRADAAAVPKLLELAGSGDDANQRACLRALAVLADARQVGALTRLVLAAKSEVTRAEAADALAAVCQRAGSALDVAPLVAGVSGNGSAEGRVALLQVCSGLVEPRIRTALRVAAKDADPVVREGGIRALCDSRDPEVLPDLLALARDAAEVNFRALAVRGYVRLATDEQTARVTGQPPLALLRQILAVAGRPEEQRAVLAGLATVVDPAALAVVTPLLDQPAVQAEAALAATQIAKAVSGASREQAEATLKKVLAVTTDAGQKAAVEAALKQIEALADYVTAWQVAGPYRENGKDYAALFDIAFAPETAPASANWRLMPVGTDPARPWLLDLLKLYGGEQCVAYLRTGVYSETEQPAVLELGSDDGVKVWLNGKQVYANNIARPLTPGSDKANVTLRAGWNPLLLKLTQNNQGWECCARFVKPDGSRLSGLRADASRGSP